MEEHNPGLWELWSKYKWKLIHTLCIFYSFILVGICCSITGPALLDLRLISGVDARHSALFITGASIGCMFGSLAIGAVSGKYDRVLMMSLSLLCAGGAVIGLPWCSQFELMVLMHGVAAFFRAGFNAAGNSEIIRMWDSQRRIFVQLLHFCFAIGGTVAPLVVEPFLAPKNNRAMSSNTSNPSVNCTSSVTTKIRTISHENSSISNIVPCSDDPEETHVQFAYLIIGCCLLLGSVSFFLKYLFDSTEQKESPNDKSSYESLEVKLPRSIEAVTVALIMACFFLITAIEASLMAWILTFVVSYFDWTKTAGTHLTTVFWVCYSAFRIGTIFFTNKISPFTLLLVTSTIALLSSCGSLVSSLYYFEPGLWVTIAISGLALASQIPSTFNWAQESIMRLSPRVISLVIFACTLPGVVNPPLIGHMMQTASPIWLFYIMTTECALCLLCIIALYFWNRCVVQPTMKNTNTA